MLEYAGRAEALQELNLLTYPRPLIRDYQLASALLVVHRQLLPRSPLLTSNRGAEAIPVLRKERSPVCACRSSFGSQFYLVVRCLPYIPVRITRHSSRKPCGSSVTKRRDDREIDTVGSKPCGPQCNGSNIVVGWLFLARERRPASQEIINLSSEVKVLNGLVFLQCCGKSSSIGRVYFNPG